MYMFFVGYEKVCLEVQAREEWIVSGSSCISLDIEERFAAHHYGMLKIQELPLFSTTSDQSKHSVV